MVLLFQCAILFPRRFARVGLGVGMFAGWQFAIQGLRQHERIHSRFNDLALLAEDDREHAPDSTEFAN